MTDWVRSYYDRVDGLDAVGVANHFAEDGTFQLGNFPPVKGRADIAAGNQAFFDTIDGLRHEFTARYTDGSVDIVEADVTYSLAGGSEITLPGIAVLERRADGLITASRSYVDMTPLSQASEGAAKTAEARQWLQTFLDAVDTLDVDRVLAFFNASATWTYGNNPPMRGLDEMRSNMEPFHKSIARISHLLTNVYAPGPNMIIAEFVVTYTRHDGVAVTVPASGFYELNGGKIETYRVYVDTAPVFA